MSGKGKSNYLSKGQIEADLYLADSAIKKAETMTSKAGKYYSRTHIIYVNGDYKDGNSDIGKLIHDFKCRKADDMYFSNLAERTRELKETKEGVDSMCTAMEKERTRSGEERTLILLLNLMRTQGWSAEQAMDAMDIPASEKPLYARSANYAVSQQNVVKAVAQQ